MKAIVVPSVLALWVLISGSTYAGNYYKWCQGGDYSGKSDCSIFTVASKKAIDKCVYSYKEKIVNVSGGKVTEIRITNDKIDCCEKRHHKDWCEMNESNLICENVCGIK